MPWSYNDKHDEHTNNDQQATKPIDAGGWVSQYLGLIMINRDKYLGPIMINRDKYLGPIAQITRRG